MTAQTIHLQAIGTVPAIPLSDVKAGDTLMWNFGQTSEVVSAVQVTPKTIELTTRTKDGQEWTSRKRAATLVARVRDFREIGRRAYLAGDPAAPALNKDVQEAIAQLPVGGGAAGIMRAFSQGWDEANLAAELV